MSNEASARAATAYMPVSVSTLRGDQPTTFDLYVHINNKHILLLRKGDHFEGSRLERLRERKLETMFVTQPEEPLYKAYVDKNLELAYGEASSVSSETRGEIAQGHQQWASELVMEDLANEDAYKQAK